MPRPLLVVLPSLLMLACASGPQQRNDKRSHQSAGRIASDGWVIDHGDPASTPPPEAGEGHHHDARPTKATVGEPPKGWGGGHHGAPIPDPAAYLQRLEGPTPDGVARDAWQKPDVVVAALGLRGDEAVADVGAGSGYFTRRLAAALPRGVVYAVEIEPAMLRHLRATADAAGHDRVVVVQGAPGGPGLAPQSVDVALVVNTWHHILDRPAWLQRMAAALRPGGRLAIVEFRQDPDRGFGPPPGALVPDATHDAELTAAGFALDRRVDLLPHQDFLILTRSAPIDAATPP